MLSLFIIITGDEDRYVNKMRAIPLHANQSQIPLSWTIDVPILKLARLSVEHEITTYQHPTCPALANQILAIGLAGNELTLI